jgi:hypothetical protein
MVFKILQYKMTLCICDSRLNVYRTCTTLLRFKWGARVCVYTNGLIDVDNAAIIGLSRL